MKNMEVQEQITHLKKIIAENKGKGHHSVYTPAKEFFRIYVGEKSSFYKEFDLIERTVGNTGEFRAIGIINSYINYIGSGLKSRLDETRRIQIDTVSDYLEQAGNILNTKGLHPAAACIIIGASLEEFLRTWIESEKISLGSSKPSLDSYAKALREQNLISKQDYKDITSWAGLRNHAAHGEWEFVSDKEKIEIMFHAVNLFIRQQSSH
jgi:hypothetical protein